MRRKVSQTRNASSKAFIYICCLVALCVYGIPRIPTLQHGIAGTFSSVWILFAGLALAANLYFFLGADKERSRMLEEQESKIRTQADQRVLERSYQ